MNSLLLESPVGTLQLIADDQYLTSIEFPGRHRVLDPTPSDNAVLSSAAQQLEEYFAGQRRIFDLPLAATGTSFQQSVWQALSGIPYGELRSYRDVAEQIGKPRAVRAVGAANGRNPLPIVVPCHRVIGSDGSLTGFAGGLSRKTLLLTLEGALLPSGDLFEAASYE